jgi:hypothetical protein
VGGIDEEFKLVCWPKVCFPILGGLGVCNLLLFNRALLGKLFWRYICEREALWSMVMDAKYGSASGGWCSNEVTGRMGWGYGRIL